MSYKIKVFIETHGCQMNVSDSEKAATKLASNGFEISHSEDEADVILINTCSIREKASHKVLTRVGEIKQSNPGQFIGVMGCVAQLDGATMFENKKDISIISGTTALERLPDNLSYFLQSKQRVLDIGENNGEDWEADFAYRHSPFVGYVPIIEGCNKFCSYCIVPFSRGRERSRSARSVINEIKDLKSSGVKEVCLIGQNVNSYRPTDDDGLKNILGATPFSKLLRTVVTTDIERIKFTTSFPRDFNEDIVCAIEENESLCNWVHLPVQSGSDSVLQRMRRGYNVSFYKNIVERIRQAKRKISLTTDIIVGFPGESDKDFAETIDLVKFSEFESAYIFKYSDRQGTPSSVLENRVNDSRMTERFLELEAVQKRIQQRKLSECVGNSYSVLVEKRSAKKEDEFTGHTTCHKVVNFKSDSEMLGKIVNINITEAKSNCLVGDLI